MRDAKIATLLDKTISLREFNRDKINNLLVLSS